MSTPTPIADLFADEFGDAARSIVIPGDVLERIRRLETEHAMMLEALREWRKPRSHPIPPGWPTRCAELLSRIDDKTGSVTP